MVTHSSEVDFVAAARRYADGRLSFGNVYGLALDLAPSVAAESSALGELVAAVIVAEAEHLDESSRLVAVRVALADFEKPVIVNTTGSRSATSQRPYFTQLGPGVASAAVLA